MLSSTQPIPTPESLDQSALAQYISTYRTTVYSDIQRRIQTDDQDDVYSQLSTCGFYVKKLSPELAHEVTTLHSSIYRKYKYSLPYLRDLLRPNLFRTINIPYAGCYEGTPLQSLIQSFYSWLHKSSIAKKQRPSLQLTRICKFSSVSMKDVYDFHVDTVYPTFKAFIFFPSKDESDLPYQFTSLAQIGLDNLLELHQYLLSVKYWYSRYSSADDYPGAIGQLTWSHSPSKLYFYRQTTGHSCAALDLFDTYVPCVSFTSRTPVLVISDNSLPHRRCWSPKSRLRSTIHFLPYERLSLSAWTST